MLAQSSARATRRPGPDLHPRSPRVGCFQPDVARHSSCCVRLSCQPLFRFPRLSWSESERMVDMKISWGWMAATATIALLCLLAVWVPFWIAGLGKS